MPGLQSTHLKTDIATMNKLQKRGWWEDGSKAVSCTVKRKHGWACQSNYNFPVDVFLSLTSHKMSVEVVIELSTSWSERKKFMFYKT